MSDMIGALGAVAGLAAAGLGFGYDRDWPPRVYSFGNGEATHPPEARIIYYPNARYHGPPTRERWELLERRRLESEERARRHAEHQQKINPKYYAEPKRDDFPSRQAYRRAVDIWKKQGSPT